MDWNADIKDQFLITFWSLTAFSLSVPVVSETSYDSTEKYTRTCKIKLTFFPHYCWLALKLVESGHAGQTLLEVPKFCSSGFMLSTGTLFVLWHKWVFPVKCKWANKSGDWDSEAIKNIYYNNNHNSFMLKYQPVKRVAVALNRWLSACTVSFAVALKAKHD